MWPLKPLVKTYPPKTANPTSATEWYCSKRESSHMMQPLPKLIKEIFLLLAHHTSLTDRPVEGSRRTTAVSSSSVEDIAGGITIGTEARDGFASFTAVQLGAAWVAIGVWRLDWRFEVYMMRPG
jgi:hypothetical protein